jgi:hypothetical protein
MGHEMILDDFWRNLYAVLYLRGGSEANNCLHRSWYTDDGSVAENDDEKRESWKQPAP